jgi:hypothetical protein
MRWWIVAVVPFCAGFGAPLGSTLPTELGVLTCTMGQAAGQGAAAPVPDQPSPDGQGREMLCTFKPAKNGPEETYAGVLTSISALGMVPNNVALMWMVRAPVGSVAVPGMLEQRFSADQSTPPGQTAPLVGDEVSTITLYAIADPAEGSASKEQRPPQRFAVTSIELKLRSSIG